MKLALISALTLIALQPAAGAQNSYRDCADCPEMVVVPAGNFLMGSVNQYVPDFEKPPLVLSGLVLTSAASSLAPTAKPDADLRQVLPGPPAATRSFAQNDQIADLYWVLETK